MSDMKVLYLANLVNERKKIESNIKAASRSTLFDQALMRELFDNLDEINFRIRLCTATDADQLSWK